MSKGTRMTPVPAANHAPSGPECPENSRGAAGYIISTGEMRCTADAIIFYGFHAADAQLLISADIEAYL